ncbi:MAG: uracil-xanthine permease family protein [Patescibacteria group bacterium]
MTLKTFTIGVQHFLAMFGATILVPVLTGLPVSMALFASGVGTLIFHLVTKGKVPAYLGSSFAFIPPIALVIGSYGGVSAALGGIIVAGLIYAVVGLLIKKYNSDFFIEFFPPVVTGPIIMVIGLTLAPTAIDQISSGVFLGIVAMLLVTICSVFFPGFIRMIPIIIGLAGGYLAGLVMGAVDLSVISEASLFGLPNFHAPSFSIKAISLIAPVALVTMIEHVGDVLAISNTIGKGRELIKDPGLGSTLLGDGLATMFAGFVGGPPNTTYSENTGVLALTKVYESKVMRIGAVIAILVSFSPKFSALIRSIPQGVIGGVSIILFGMIAGVGLRTLVENSVDFKKSRNLIIVGVTLIVGLGGAVVNIGALEFSGLALAAVLAIVLNKALPADLEFSKN